MSVGELGNLEDGTVTVVVKIEDWRRWRQGDRLRTMRSAQAAKRDQARARKLKAVGVGVVSGDVETPGGVNNHGL